MIASVVPFGTFYIDVRLRRFQERTA